MTNESQSEVKEVIEIEAFDLPIDDSAPRATPRVHVAPGDSACTSCEG